MTIKCLTKEEQNTISEWYNVVKTPISDLAYIYGVSARTVSRVLTEHGFALPLAQRTGYSYKVMRILNDHDVTAENLSELLVLGIQAKKDANNRYVFDLLQAQEFEDLPF